MLQKVKKFRDKLFSTSTSDDAAAGASPSHNGMAPSAPDSVDNPRTSTLRRGSSSLAVKKDAAEGALAGISSNSFVMKAGSSASFSSSKRLADAQASNGIIPSVSISRAAHALVPTRLSSPSTAASRRRKSTPAELDMALRTPEGKAAIDDLLNNNPNSKKPMAFAQYFGAPTSTMLAKAAPPSLASPGPGLGSGAPSPSLKVSSPKGPGMHSPITSPTAPMASMEPRPPVEPRAPLNARSSSVKPAAEPSLSQKHDDENHPGRKNKVLALSPNMPISMTRKYWSLSDYCIGRKMYTGYASTVYQATCKKSAEQVALKIYHMENLCELNHYQVYREVRVHSGLQHQNIIHLISAFEEGTDVILVQEYAEGGDLYRLLHRNGGRLAERQAVEMVLHPFLLALHYLHTRGIMHRDIKPENVLFTDQRVLKLADFGLAIDLNEEKAVTRAGTLDYMAPEVLRCPPKNLPQENKNNTYLHYNNSVDAWAVGVFAYELVVGFPPFAGETQLDSVDKIMHSTTPEFPEKMTELAKAFVTQALKKHPGDRPTVMEMLHHTWIRSYQRRTSSLYMPASSQRRSSSACLNDDATAAAATRAVKASGSNANSVAPSTGQAGKGLSDTDIEDMSPEEIEQMIKKLMIASGQAK